MSRADSSTGILNRELLIAVAVGALLDRGWVEAPTVASSTKNSRTRATVVPTPSSRRGRSG